MVGDDAQLVVVQSVRITRGGFLTFHTKEDNPGNPEALKKARAQLAEKGYNGEMSTKAKSKARRYVANWITTLNAQAGNCWNTPEAQAQRITFVTLTLPSQQFHTDNEIKRQCLRPFLQELKRRYGADNYLWRAEPQANGNIHFHILLDRFIPAYPLRKLWNTTVEKLGYVRGYMLNMSRFHRHGFKVRRDLLKWWPLAKQKEAYEYGRRTAWQNPNTTDIHVLRKVKNVVAYVVKYISKAGENRKIEGRIWECSDTVRSLEPCEFELDQRFDGMLRTIAHENTAEVLKGDGFTFYRCDTKKVLETFYDEVGLLFVTHWQEQAAKFNSPLLSKLPTPKPPPLCSAPAKQGT